MKRLKQDVKLNSISEYSFICTDRTFFAEGFNLTEKPSGKSEKKDAMAAKNKPSKALEEDDLGFCNGGDSSSSDNQINNNEDY